MKKSLIIITFLVSIVTSSIVQIESQSRILFTSAAGNKFITLHNDNSAILHNDDGSIAASVMLDAPPLKKAGFNEKKTIFAIADINGKLSAYQIPTMKKLWELELATTKVSEIGSGDGLFALVTRSIESSLLLIDAATGKSKTLFKTSSISIAAPAISKNAVCISTTDGQLHLINIIDGKTLWTSQGGAFFSSASYQIIDDKVIAGADGTERKIFLSETWDLSLPAPKIITETDELSNALFSRQNVREYAMKRFLAKQGATIDTTFLPTGHSSMSEWVIKNNVGYISIKEPDILARARYTIKAINLIDGREIFSFSKIAADIPENTSQSPVITKNRIYMIFGGDSIAVLNLHNGNQITAIALLKTHTASPIKSGSSIIFTSTDGSLSALQLGEEDGIPSKFELHQNSPNPFNPNTTISYSIPKAGEVILEILSVDGRVVNKLINQHFEAGRFSLNWDGKNNEGKISAAGNYIARLTSNGNIKTIRMQLLK